ncbi:MAG: glycosyltransferase [Rhodobacteraceae bacterium]|nr:glycosyltransferase [Paracoccaceae bacterium]
MVAQITALVPTFNRGALLAEAIEAILLQKRAVSQIIVWDDGSTDNTSDIIAPFLRNDGARIDYRRAENAGKSAALNQAMELAQGEYIWICDDDDIALPDATQKLAAILDEKPEVGLAAGAHNRFSTAPETGEKELSDAGYWPNLNSGSPLRHVLEDIFFFQNATLVRRACYDKVGPFSVDLARSIDYDMTVRLMARYPAEVIEDTVFLQRKHDGERGPAWQRHAAKSSEDVWRNADKIVFERLRDRIPISLYEAMFDGDSSELCSRAALLQRGAVYARRRDWDQALEDFEAAVLIRPELALSPEECRIAIRAVAGKHGAQELFEASTRKRILDISKRATAGKSLARTLSRGAVWRLREALANRNASEVLAITAFLAAQPPWSIPTATGRTLTERDRLPLEAYAW